MYWDFKSKKRDRIKWLFNEVWVLFSKKNGAKLFFFEKFLKIIYNKTIFKKVEKVLKIKGYLTK